MSVERRKGIWVPTWLTRAREGMKRAINKAAELVASTTMHSCRSNWKILRIRNPRGHHRPRDLAGQWTTD